MSPHFLQPYDALVINGRPALFMWWMWKGRTYAKVRFTDNNERAIVHKMDFNTPPVISQAEVSEVAKVMVGAVKDALGMERVS